MNKRDRDALHRCLAMAMADPQRAAQLKAFKERGDSWEKRATFACFDVQMNSLGLRPWECPPCWSEPVDGPQNSSFETQRRRAKVVADKLRAAGLSIYEPNPLAALNQLAKVKVGTSPRDAA